MRIAVTTLFWLAGLFSCASVSAAPSYIGDYKYIAARCGPSYGPFNNLDEAVKTAANAEYGGKGCGSPSATLRMWSSANTGVVTCGGQMNTSTMVEGVESQGIGSFTVQYSAGQQCENSYKDGITVVRSRVVCRSDELYFEDLKACDTIVKYIPPFADPKNNGPQCPECSRGDPINPFGGNNWRVDVDYPKVVKDGLYFSRTYNSNPITPDADGFGPIGSRWKHTYDRKLRKILVNSPRFVPVCYRRWSDKKSYCSAPTRTADGIDIAAEREDGKIFYFDWDGNKYITDKDVNATLQVIRNSNNVVIGWQYHNSNGDIESYDAAGKLVEIAHRTGNRLHFTYTDGVTNETSVGRQSKIALGCAHVQEGSVLPAGLLACVTDDAGRQLKFEYDNKGRIRKLIDPLGSEIKYGYDGPSGGCGQINNTTNLSCNSNNLTSVTFSDGATRIYWYNELSRINKSEACFGIPIKSNSGNGFGHLLRSLTGITDENGSRSATWGYDCDGNATENFLGNGIAKINFSFGPYTEGKGSSNVSAEYGSPTAPLVKSSTYQFETILGVGRNTGIGQACADCGPIMSRKFDINGNVSSDTNWVGTVTSYKYDLLRNLEVKRIEAVGTPQERTITKIWHPTLRLKSLVAEPEQIAIFEYDDAANLVRRTIQATTDKNGSLGIEAFKTGQARIWQYSYSEFGKLMSATGPRTDVVDQTTYTYDEQGNLATMTNALGHVTSYSNYDSNGRLGRVVAPNGLTTEINYHSRGWITSQTVSDGTAVETTSFIYDSIGQLLNVVYPDGSSLTYNYDAAHRLIKVFDNIGNSVTYTLDTVGNRTVEQVTGPDGVLTRKINRVFDTLNNLQKITGAL